MKLFITLIFTLVCMVSCSERSREIEDNPSQVEEVESECAPQKLASSEEDRPLPSKLSGQVSMSLESGEKMHSLYPDSFWIPTRELRESVKKDDLVKLLFLFKSGSDERGERMWVIVTEKKGDQIFGILDNDPYCTDQYKSGFEVEFRAENIIHIWDEGEE